VLIVISTLRLWNGESASWHFIDVPPADATEIRVHSLTSRGGFGSVKVKTTIGDVVWRTSVFPQKSGGYFLPVKKEMRCKTGIAAGDEVRVELELL